MAWTEHKIIDGQTWYRGRWRTAGRKHQTEWVPSQHQAAWWAELAERDQLTEGTAEGTAEGPQSPAGKTVGEYALSWLKAVQAQVAAGALEQITFNTYRARIHTHLLGTPLAGLPIRTLSKGRGDKRSPWQHVEDWRLGLKGSPTTRNNAFMVFTIMFRDAVFHGATLTVQPIMKHARAKGQVRQVFIMEPEQEAALLAAAKADGPHGDLWHIMIMVALDTGLRWGEVAGLTVASIKDDHLVKLQAVKPGGRIGAPKGQNHSGHDEEAKTIPLTSRLKAALKPWVREASLRGGRKALLFLSPRGGPVAYNTWLVHFNRAKRAALGPDAGDLVGHHMRHSFATHAQERGLDLMDVKYLLDHKDAKTSQGYLTITPARKDRMAKALAS